MTCSPSVYLKRLKFIFLKTNWVINYRRYQHFWFVSILKITPWRRIAIKLFRKNNIFFFFLELTIFLLQHLSCKSTDFVFNFTQWFGRWMLINMTKYLPKFILSQFLHFLWCINGASVDVQDKCCFRLGRTEMRF